MGGGNTGCMSAREDISFLVGSESRVAILRTVSGETYRPTELAGVCSCARETAQRTLSGFAERGWVEKENGGYRCTPAGELILDQYGELETIVNHAGRMSKFFANAGDAADIPVSVLDDVTFTESTKGSPHAPLNRYLEVFGNEQVETLRGITPIVSRMFNDAASRAIGDDTSAELLIDESVLRTSRAGFADDLRTAARMEQFELYLSSEPIEFGLSILDDHVCVGAYDDSGNLVACVDGTDDRLVEWATDLYRERRGKAERLVVEDIPEVEEGDTEPAGDTDRQTHSRR